MPTLSIIQKIIIVLTFTTITPVVLATNVGVFGQTYTIQEEDFLSFIENKIVTMQKNGEWQRILNVLKDRVSKHIDRPNPVSALKRTAQAKAWDYDPSIIVPYDLHDTEGHVFAKAGTRVNPLNMITLHSAMAFYNADDSDQVKWARKINQKYTGKIKLILVNGSVSSQEGLFHQPIYFDQKGRLTSRFHIQQVPALVYQERDHLKITEVLP